MAEKETQSLNAERLHQLVRVGFPFNPISGKEIFGGNLTRLQKSMNMFGWNDPRFISAEEAEKNGWRVAEKATGTITEVRDLDSGRVDKVTLYNAKDVEGIPSIAKMMLMNDNELAQLQAGSVVEETIELSPAQELEIEHQADVVEETHNDLTEAQSEAPALSGNFEVMANYWLSNLHNSKGIELAKQLNAEILKHNLTQDREGIEMLLGAHPKAKRLGIKVVTAEEKAADLNYQINPAEPKKLLNGDYVRDKDGSYRPKEGGKVILEDKGDAIVLKGKNKDSYEAAIELAKAKGWSAIELKGKPAMMANAWLEAKMKGIDVVNYAPNKDDLEKYAARLAKERLEKQDQDLATPPVSKTLEQTPEQVIVKPYVDAEGQNKTATISYTVCYEQEGAKEQKFTDPQKAAHLFNSLPGNTVPSVLRTTTTVDGKSDVGLMIAGTDMPSKNNFVKSADANLDAKFAAALSEEIAEEKAQHAGVKTFSGMILRIEGNQVIQKVGRNPDEIKKHDIAALSRVPQVGTVEDITYDKNGMGILKEQGQSREYGGHEIAR